MSGKHINILMLRYSMQFNFFYNLIEIVKYLSLD